jgi:MerR HTH family regulatory protein
MDKKFVKIGKAAAMIGATSHNLRQWEKSGELLPAYKTTSGARFYCVDDLLGFANRGLFVAKVGRPRKAGAPPRKVKEPGFQWLHLPRAVREQLYDLASNTTLADF